MRESASSTPVAGNVGRPPVLRLRASQEFIDQQYPNTFAALFRAIVDATALCAQAGKPQADRRGDRAGQLPQPAGNRAGTGDDRAPSPTASARCKNVPDRVDFDPFPWQSMAVWMLTQMKRWGYIKGDIDYQAVAEQVFLATDAGKRMTEIGMTPPAATHARHPSWARCSTRRSRTSTSTASRSSGHEDVDCALADSARPAVARVAASPCSCWSGSWRRCRKPGPSQPMSTRNTPS